MKTVCFIISNSNQFEFTCLTKLISTFKVRPSLSKEQENIKNEEMSRLYKWLSIEGGFKPSAHYSMNYSAVNQIRYV